MTSIGHRAFIRGEPSSFPGLVSFGLYTERVREKHWEQGWRGASNINFTPQRGVYKCETFI